MRIVEEVEVQSTLGGWSPGFEIVEVDLSEPGHEMIRLRRRSDGSVLPPVSGERVRPTRSLVEAR